MVPRGVALRGAGSSSRCRPCRGRVFCPPPRAQLQGGRTHSLRSAQRPDLRWPVPGLGRGTLVGHLPLDTRDRALPSSLRLVPTQPCRTRGWPERRGGWASGPPCGVCGEGSRPVTHRAEVTAGDSGHPGPPWPEGQAASAPGPRAWDLRPRLLALKASTPCGLPALTPPSVPTSLCDLRSESPAAVSVFVPR